MKKIFITSLIILGFFLKHSYSQTVSINIQDVESYGINISDLDEQYPSAASANPEQGILDNQKRFLQEYQQLLRKVALYLNKNGIDWGSTTNFVHRIYFSKNGTIDYFLFNTPGKNLDDEKIKKYIEKFSKDYKLSFTADTTFKQCGTVPIQFSN